MKFFARKVHDYTFFSLFSWHVPGLGGVVGLLAWYLAGALLAACVSALCALVVPATIWRAYGLVVVYPLQFLPAMMHSLRVSQSNSLFDTGYRLDGFAKGPYAGWEVVGVTLLLALSTMVVADLPNYVNFRLTLWLPHGEELYERFQYLMQEELLAGPVWRVLLVTAVFAPCFEEWLCRGMALRGLLVRMRSRKAAIALSALLFALIHLNPWQALNAFLVGVALGYVYCRTGSLRLTMLMHCVHNACAVLCTRIPALSAHDYLVDMMPLPAYIALYALFLAVLVLCWLFFRRIPLAASRGNIEAVVL